MKKFYTERNFLIKFQENKKYFLTLLGILKYNEGNIFKAFN